MLYRDIAPLVAMDAMGAPIPRIVGAVAQAANEFFRRTMAYKLSLTPQTLEVGQRRVSLLIPPTTSLAGIRRVTYGGRPIDPAVNLPVNWEALTGSPRGYLVSTSGADEEQDFVEVGYVDDTYLVATGAQTDEFDSIRLIPYLAAAEPNAVISVDYAVAPFLSATSIPDPVANRYMHSLVSGAKSFVLGDANKPWSNPTQSVLYRKQFQADIDQGILDARLASAPTQNVRVKLRRL